VIALEINWILQNKKWLFDGVLVAVPLAIIGWLFARKVIKVRQRQRGGDSSTNVQIGNVENQR
jgi:hypothetical protein